MQNWVGLGAQCWKRVESRTCSTDKLGVETTPIAAATGAGWLAGKERKKRKKERRKEKKR